MNTIEKIAIDIQNNFTELLFQEWLIRYELELYIRNKYLWTNKSFAEEFQNLYHENNFDAISVKILESVFAYLKKNTKRK